MFGIENDKETGSEKKVVCQLVTKETFNTIRRIQISTADHIIPTRPRRHSKNETQSIAFFAKISKRHRDGIVSRPKTFAIPSAGAAIAKK
jgi:hypothetical protein